MKCAICPKFYRVKNTKETGKGVCSFPNSFISVEMDDECIFMPQLYTCNDCDRYGNDDLCMGMRADDPAYIEGELCPGFVDKKYVDVVNALTEWKLRGLNIEERLNKAFKEADDVNPPWI